MLTRGAGRWCAAGRGQTATCGRTAITRMRAMTNETTPIYRPAVGRGWCSGAGCSKSIEPIQERRGLLARSQESGIRRQRREILSECSGRDPDRFSAVFPDPRPLNPAPSAVSICWILPIMPPIPTLPTPPRAAGLAGCRVGVVRAAEAQVLRGEFDESLVSCACAVGGRGRRRLPSLVPANRLQLWQRLLRLRR